MFPRQRILSDSDIGVRVFLRKTESFMTIGQGSSGKMLVPNVRRICTWALLYVDVL